MFAMNDISAKTCESLKGLLRILTCSICKANLHDLQQFSKSGQILCNSCINRTSSPNVKHQYCKKQFLYVNNIEKIINICCNIADIVGYRRTVQSTEENFKCKCQNDTKHCLLDEPTNKKNFKSNKSSMINSIMLNHLKKDSVNKLKRKHDINLKVKAKKNKNSKGCTNLSIPKNINKRNHHGETKLQQACKKGNKESVKLLLEAGADPNISCNANWTPLQETADFGFYEITEMLLEAGADVNQPGYEGRTALHEAAKNNNLKIIKLLLKYNANKDSLDNNGNKPVDYCNFEDLKILLVCNADNNVDNNAQNHNRKTKPVGKSQKRRKEVVNSKKIRKSVKGERKEKTYLNSNIIRGNNTNDTDDDINLLFENFPSNSNSLYDSKKIKEDTNNFYNSSENIVDIISEVDSEKFVHEVIDLQSIKDTNSQNNECKLFLENVIILSADSEDSEIIDIIN